MALPDLPNKNAGQPVPSEFQINSRDYFNIGISWILNIKQSFVFLKFKLNQKSYIFIKHPFNCGDSAEPLLW